MSWTTVLTMLAAVLLIAGGGLSPVERQAPGPAGSGPYTLSWYTISGGGTTESAGGDFTLGGTTGQPDAGLLAGGGYRLGGGFWGGGALSDGSAVLYLPLLVRE